LARRTSRKIRKFLPNAHEWTNGQPKAFLGTWRIVETELWDRDALDESEPAQIAFDQRGGGAFRMLYVYGEIDPRFEGDRVDFTWVGHDEMDEASGRGSAEIGKDGKLSGRIYFHMGDDSSFVATRFRATGSRSASARRGRRSNRPA